MPDANLVPVYSTDDVIYLMNLGQKNRAVGATALNDRSSRSHRFNFCCLTIFLLSNYAGLYLLSFDLIFTILNFLLNMVKFYWIRKMTIGSIFNMFRPWGHPSGQWLWSHYQT